MGKISGPLLDRISIHLFVRPVEIEAFKDRHKATPSRSMFERVIEARARQKHRYGGGGPTALNARLPEKRIREYCKLGGSATRLLVRAQKQLRISARGRSHILRVARTIADLEGAEAISDDHIGEAIQYRKRVVGP